MTEVLQEYQFAEVIGSEEELRAIIGTPLQRAIDKANESLDEYCRRIYRPVAVPADRVLRRPRQHGHLPQG